MVRWKGDSAGAMKLAIKHSQHGSRQAAKGVRSSRTGLKKRIVGMLKELSAAYKWEGILLAGLQSDHSAVKVDDILAGTMPWRCAPAFHTFCLAGVPFCVDFPSQCAWERAPELHPRGFASFKCSSAEARMCSLPRASVGLASVALWVPPV